MKASTHCIAVLLALADMSCAAAGPRISAGDLPGRERERFVDPPVARAMQPIAPGVILLREATPPVYRTCPRRTQHRHVRIVRC